MEGVAKEETAAQRILPIPPMWILKWEAYVKRPGPRDAYQLHFLLYYHSHQSRISLPLRNV